MASGYGIKGGPSRCFSFWQDFRKCYISSDSPSECSLQKDDYLECLHHTKELERAHALQSRMIEVQQEESKQAREKAKVNGLSGLRLGLINIDEMESDSKDEPAKSEDGQSEDGQSEDGQSKDEPEEAAPDAEQESEEAPASEDSSGDDKDEAKEDDA